MLSQDSSKEKKKIIIVDFGSQVTKLIARRVRELRVFCEIVSLKEFKAIKSFKSIKGIILSGGPSTVTKKIYPKISKNIFEKNIPILRYLLWLTINNKSFRWKNSKVSKKKESLEKQFY